MIYKFEFTSQISILLLPGDDMIAKYFGLNYLGFWVNRIQLILGNEKFVSLITNGASLMFILDLNLLGHRLRWAACLLNQCFHFTQLLHLHCLHQCFQLLQGPVVGPLKVYPYHFVYYFILHVIYYISILMFALWKLMEFCSIRRSQYVLIPCN